MSSMSFPVSSRNQGDMLIFGHTTYELMKSYWTTPDAIRNNPSMAEVMNNIQKIVFSKTCRVWRKVLIGKTLSSSMK